MVVNLGTNDCNRPIEAKAWTDSYRAFIARIRAWHPSVKKHQLMADAIAAEIAKTLTWKARDVPVVIRREFRARAFRSPRR